MSVFITRPIIIMTTMIATIVYMHAWVRRMPTSNGCENCKQPAQNGGGVGTME